MLGLEMIKYSLTEIRLYTSEIVQSNGLVMFSFLCNSQKH